MTVAGGNTGTEPGLQADFALELPAKTGQAIGTVPFLFLPTRVRDTLKKSSFPRRRESRILILLGFAFGKHGFSESIRVSLGSGCGGGSGPCPVHPFALV